MKLKNVLLVIGGFLAGVVTTGIVAVKVIKTLLKSIVGYGIFRQIVKDSWIDLFIKALYGNTDGYIERKLREEGYVRHKYRPTYERYSDWKRNHPDWNDKVNSIYGCTSAKFDNGFRDEEDEAWKRWRDKMNSILERRMNESEEE